MAKYLKEVLKGVKSSTKVTNDLGGYKPKAGDEEDFAKKHEIEKHADRVGNGDDVYKGTTKHVLANPKEKNHGYKKPEDAKVNEEQIDELSTDLLHRAAHKAAKKAMTDVQGRSGPIFKKRAAQANKFRAKGMEQEKKEKTVKEEAFDEKERSQSELTAKWAHHSNQAYLTKQKAKTALKGAEGSKDPKDYDIAGDYQRKAQLHKKAAGIAGKAIKEEETIDEAYGSSAGKKATGTKWSDNSVSVSVHHDGKKHTFTGKHEYVAKKLKAAHGIGMHQVNFKKASDMKEENIDELSKTTLGNYAHAGVRDIASRQYALGKGDKSNTGKLMNRRKGVDKAISKLTKESETPITFPNKQSNNAVGQNV